MTETTDSDEIRGLVAAYEKALRESDAGALARMFAPDGTFFPYDLPPSTGGQIEGTFGTVFDTIAVDVVFHIEQMAIDGDLAYVICTSDGTVTLLAEDLTTPEVDRGVFALRRVAGRWRIAAYIFNRTPTYGAVAGPMEDG
ncbi:hypothetical protein BTM25_44650 [Actinomadura rubteroloni]|uniref:DUF4440 domain-containing protein n=1 Tax=Actinomadura rubteroloni TaxID=1926885 RepID=A0A2P4UE72_9ACTN|nr:nuclear transport factor 2 family protein [Actinomadura rubteroloni]POM23312.1 hypothetical protein BTM25_44650 [Actinomadura rubteroloni]